MKTDLRSQNQSSRVQFLKILIILVYIMTCKPMIAQTNDADITKLFKDSYHLIKSTRNSNGLYIDALSLPGSADKPGAIVACGVGLVSLCIADSMYKKTGDELNWESNADSLVKITIKKFQGFKQAGLTTKNGLFSRYFDINTGAGVWGPEYSTIDNAILATGFIFCKNYFNKDTEIVSAVDDLLSSMDFTAAISGSGNQMYMTVKQNGLSASPTGAFNEYILVSWLAKNTSTLNPGYSKSQTYWNHFYSNPKTAAIVRKTYINYELICDGNFLSSFVFHVPFYYCHYFRNNTDYLNYIDNARKADSLWWHNVGATNPYEWGLGAGEVPGGGYHADKIFDNDLKTVSPCSIGGFLPIYEAGKNDLKNHLTVSNSPSVYSLPDDTSRKVLWRYNITNPSLKCGYIQLVDFSYMFYGLASLPEYLGSEFFDTFNEIKDTLPYKPILVNSTRSLNNENITVNISPNPVSNIAHIEYTLSSPQRISISLYNGTGSLIKTIKNKWLTSGDNVIDIDFSEFKPGIYYLNCISEYQFCSKLILKD